jgi:benzoate membrane transport protein
MRFLKDLSVSAINAGFVTVLVGYTSSAVIVFQAAAALGASPAQIGSWIWALGLGMGLTCIAFSLRYRMPLATAWSTSGAAMLITSASGISLPEATGAFLVSGAMVALAGFSGGFERAIHRIPMPLAAGMLSGVLLRFGLDAFGSMKTQPALVLAMFCAYLVTRRVWPRYAVMVPLLLGTLIAAGQGTLHLGAIHWEIARPVLVVPAFSLQAIVGIALPLFIVTMASQNVPALAVLRASDFKDAPVSPLIGWTGVATMLFAPFGGYALNLATITAAICIGREAHEEPSKRYVAGVFAGVFYALTGLFGATIGALFAAFPKELVLALAGLALLGSIGNGLATAMSREGEREPALITFLVTASGVAMFGIGSAFWGLIAGGLAMAVLHRPRQAATAQAAEKAPEPAAAKRT